MGTDLGCGSLWASLMLARIDQGPERVKPRDHGLEHPAHACVAACGVREGCACITPKPSLMKAPSGPRETHQPNRTRNPSGAGSKKRFAPRHKTRSDSKSDTLLLIRQALFVNLARAEVSKPLDGLKLNGIGTLQ